MKKSLFLLTMISVAYATTTAAQDRSFYAGLGIGRTSTTVTETSRQEFLDDIQSKGFNSLSGFQSGSNESDTAWKIYGGYRFTTNVAAEFFYANLGKFSNSASGTAAPGPSSIKLSSDLKITGFGAAALIGIPLGDQWNVFAKPGLLYWDAKLTSTLTQDSATNSGSLDKKGTSPSLGVGTDYAFTDRFSARFEVERFFNVGDKNTTDKSNVNIFALSVQFTP